MTTHKPMLVSGRVLVTRKALAVLTARHPSTIRQHCQPVACLATRSRTLAPVLLYDADECEAVLRHAGRRARTAA